MDIASFARSSVLLGAAAAGISAVDAPFLDTLDADGLRLEALDSAACGFAAKACIHPDQVAVVRTAFRASLKTLHWARQVVTALSDGGVAVVDGQMVDEPLLRQAKRIISGEGDMHM
jgi:citrate lyase subunit beta/citryl-CoA lyase